MMWRSKRQAISTDGPCKSAGTDVDKQSDTSNDLRVAFGHFQKAVDSSLLEMKQQLTDCQRRLQRSEATVAQLNKLSQGQQQHIQQVQQEAEWLRRRANSHNLILFGLWANPGENTRTLTAAVQHLLGECGCKVQLQQAVRMHSSVVGTIAPILLVLGSDSDKHKLFEVSSRLR
jgi:hypothetical protein